MEHFVDELCSAKFTELRVHLLKIGRTPTTSSFSSCLAQPIVVVFLKVVVLLAIRVCNAKERSNETVVQV